MQEENYGLLELDNIILTQIIAKLFESGDITKNRSNETTNTNGQMIIQIVNKPTGFFSTLTTTLFGGKTMEL